MLQQWNMEGVKFHLLCNNFIKKISFEKIKSVWKRNVRAIFSCIICQCETKTVRVIPRKPFIYTIKQCLNLESYDLKLTVMLFFPMHLE